MPTRCVVPCNPVCCANCINPGKVGTEADETVEGESRGQQGGGPNGKGAGIFANAASVLSMAAEEISLDDTLEKEIANEVELWRMETSGAAIHKTLQESSNSRGLKGLASVRSASADQQFGNFSVPFGRDRSLSPPPRTQVSLHDRGGLGEGLRHRPESSGASSGSAGIQAEPRVDRFGMGMKPPARPRGSAGVHARAAGPAAEATPDGDANATGATSLFAAADVAGGSPREPAAPRGRSLTREDQPSSRPGEEDEDDGVAPLMLHAGGVPSSGTANEQPLAAATATADGPAGIGNSNAAVAAQPAAAAPGALQPSAMDGPADPRRAPVEPDIEMSSSDESTFAGFIEDPLDRERSGDVQTWTSQTWTSGPGGAAALLGADIALREIPSHGDQGLPCDTEGDEDVRPDRSEF